MRLALCSARRLYLALLTLQANHKPSLLLPLLARLTGSLNTAPSRPAQAARGEWRQLAMGCPAHSCGACRQLQTMPLIRASVSFGNEKGIRSGLGRETELPPQL